MFLRDKLKKHLRMQTDDESIMKLAMLAGVPVQFILILGLKPTLAVTTVHCIAGTGCTE